MSEASPAKCSKKRMGGGMKRVLLLAATIAVFACLAEAQISGMENGSRQLAAELRPGLPDDDDPELIQPGPEGQDGEAIDPALRMRPADDDGE
jgi:hypothetical protein